MGSTTLLVDLVPTRWVEAVGLVAFGGDCLEDCPRGIGEEQEGWQRTRSLCPVLRYSHGPAAENHSRIDLVLHRL